MRTALDCISIGGVQLPKPPEFSPQIEDLYAGEYTTCTGKLIADRIGWKYSDMTLEWNALPQWAVDVLCQMSGAMPLTFDGLDGLIQTESIIRTSAVGLRHRYTVDGEVWWTGVQVEVRFINAHNS